jgi:acyl-coenzyme A synthetase/AMP-(fatty) acid ligase
MNLLPLLAEYTADLPLLRDTALLIARNDFARRARALAVRLPHATYAINLCQERRHFMLGFVAACLRGQTNLLPPSQAKGAIADIANAYRPHHVLDDAAVEALSQTPDSKSVEDADPPSVAPEHIAAICFTSGSTGAAQAHPSSWALLTAAAKRSAAGIFTTPGLSLVATVPPQHMFGLETSVLQPLLNRCSVHDRKPFFPADIAAALQSVPAPRALITTPTHLRACLDMGAKLPLLDFVLSATAPLAATVAERAEAAWNTRVLEIYGSTEAGAMATRRTVQGDAWTLLPGGSLQLNGNARFKPDGGDAVVLHDELQPIDHGRFLLLGRSGDLIKVAGKRASFADLNSKLLAVRGVIDAVVFQPAVDGRVAALAVVDGLQERDILTSLSAQLDEVFLPRPLRIVAALPRDSLGKLSRAHLLAALQSA